METFYIISDDYFYFNIIISSAYLYLLGTYYSNKRKERELNEQEDSKNIHKEKIRIAAEMHDDLGADLSNLLFKLKIYQNINGNKNIAEYQAIEGFTKEIIKKVNETIWTLNSEKDTLSSLSNFMLKFLDDFLERDSIVYHYQNEIGSQDTLVVIEKRRSIFHLFKDTMKYIVLYDELQEVIVNLKFEENTLLIHIGFKGKLTGPQNVKQQKLLELMEERINILKAVFTNEKNEVGTNEIIFKILI
jgi:glucose-6-phosphate-specific signal transduction histidine kinase